MKIIDQHLRRLRLDCEAALVRHNIPASRIKTERDRWDMFHAAKGYWLYDEGLDDRHIDTALRTLFSH